MTRSFKTEVCDYSVYLAVRLLICFIQSLSLRGCQKFARIMGWIASDVFHLREKVTVENLRASFPELSERKIHVLKRQMWEHLILMVCEIALTPRKVHQTNWHKYISVPQKRKLVGRLLEDRPLVLVSGHFGNFEIAGFAAGLLGFPTYAIARDLDNPYLHRFIQKFREAKGQYILPKEGSANRVKDVLDTKQTLALLADQHAGKKGCWIDFFGRPASCHKAVSVFTLTSDAPMLVVYGRRVGGPLQFEIGIEGEADPADLSRDLAGIRPLTQWYSARLEDMIRRAPEQYWWLHRRWKEPPRKRKKRKRPMAA